MVRNSFRYFQTIGRNNPEPPGTTYSGHFRSISILVRFCFTTTFPLGRAQYPRPLGFFQRLRRLLEYWKPFLSLAKQSKTPSEYGTDPLPRTRNSHGLKNRSKSICSEYAWNKVVLNTPCYLGNHLWTTWTCSDTTTGYQTASTGR